MSSQLIQMRQRIRAIETIKKITHAMRLISMSLHGRLKSKESPLAACHHEMNALFGKIKSVTPDWTNSIAYPDPNLPRKTLAIIIGSNKGLCGNFNTSLFNAAQPALEALPAVHYIVLGRKAIDYSKKQYIGSHVASFDNVAPATISSISSQIKTEIMDPAKQYTSVIVFSNRLKNFFIQKPHTTRLIPFLPLNSASHVEYIWEQKPENILDYLVGECLQAHLEYLLFESLLAEQAARFISMDSATRNAKNILEETQLQYNKVRQAKITKELTELTGSF